MALNQKMVWDLERFWTCRRGSTLCCLHLLSRLHYEVVRYLIIGRSYESQANLPQSLMEFVELAVQKLDPGVLNTDSKSRAPGKRLELVYTA